MDTPGVDGLFAALRCEKNIWRLFGVDKLPGAPETKLVSLTLPSFSAGDTQLRISSEGKVKVTGNKLLLLHVREKLLGVLLDQQWQREKKE